MRDLARRAYGSSMAAVAGFRRGLSSPRVPKPAGQSSLLDVGFSHDGNLLLKQVLR